MSCIFDVNGCRIQWDTVNHVSTSRRDSTGLQELITATFDLCKKYSQTIIVLILFTTDQLHKVFLTVS